MFAIHIYSIIAFAEQRQAYSRWNPQYLKKSKVGKRRAKEWFYFAGCLDEIKRRLTIILLVAFSIINFVIQCIALVYSQITCTSYYMVSHCDAQDSAAILPAWILPFPPPYPQTIVKKCQELLKQGHGYRELVT
ncbi:hypothetical protein ACO02O_09218 [Dirofilaria immitis]